MNSEIIVKADFVNGVGVVDNNADPFDDSGRLFLEYDEFWTKCRRHVN